MVTVKGEAHTNEDVDSFTCATELKGKMFRQNSKIPLIHSILVPAMQSVLAANAHFAPLQSIKHCRSDAHRVLERCMCSSCSGAAACS